MRTLNLMTSGESWNLNKIHQATFVIGSYWIQRKLEPPATNLLKQSAPVFKCGNLSRSYANLNFKFVAVKVLFR